MKKGFVFCAIIVFLFFSVFINLAASSFDRTNVSVKITDISEFPNIDEYGIYYYAEAEGLPIKLFISASNAEYTWAEIENNVSTSIILLTNNENTTFSDTSQIGRYNVTFYANNSNGDFVNETDYFEIFEHLVFNFSVVDNDYQGIESAWNLIYRNQIIRSNESQTGIYSEDAMALIGDIRFLAHSDRLDVLLKKVNLSNENNKEFGMDKLEFPLEDYLVNYGIKNHYNFENATIKFYYDNLNFNNESNLRLDKCENWDFEEQICQGDFQDITGDSTQNKNENYFEYETSNFSGFGIREFFEVTPPEPRPPSRGVRTVEIPTEPPIVSYDIDSDLIRPKEISLEMVQKEIKRFELELKNTGNTEINFSFDSDLDFISLPSDFSLEAGEKKMVGFTVRAPSEIGKYIGSIFIDGKGLKKEIIVKIEVKSGALFDVSTEVLPDYKNIFYPNAIVKAKTELINLGVGEVELEITSYISKGEDFIVGKEKTAKVGERYDFMEELFLPEGLEEGEYKFNVLVKYDDIVLTSYDTFYLSEEKRIFCSLIIAICIVFLLMIIFILLARKKRKKKKYKISKKKKFKKKNKRKEKILKKTGHKELEDIVEK